MAVRQKPRFSLLLLRFIIWLCLCTLCPNRRGHFLTYGCETKAEILFAAATLYNLALFVHFSQLGPSWASPRNTGTRATERMISELQGKTNQIQSLNSQPTFADMLINVSAV